MKNAKQNNVLQTNLRVVQAGGNCTQTTPGEVIKTANGVTVIGRTDWPSQMAAQSSTLYGNNVRCVCAPLACSVCDFVEMASNACTIFDLFEGGS